MRDWEVYVRTHLPPSALGQARESRIVRELASQIEDCYRDALARGLSDSEADAFASAQITDWTSFADTLAEADRPHRRSRIDRWSERFDDRGPHVRPRMSGLGGIWQDSLRDVRYAVRTLLRAPVFAATVVMTMGLGIGLLGTAFTVFNAYLFKPVDLPNPHALYSLSWDTDIGYRQRFRLADYEVLQPEAREFADVAAAQDARIRQEDVTSEGLLVTGNYFELLGARPMLGRLLRPEDSSIRGAGAVVVLSHQIWRSRYGADPSIIGQRVSLGRQRFEVVGVTVPHAQLAGQELVSFWAPLTMASAFAGVDPWSEPNTASLVVFARLKPNVSPASMQAWLEVWLERRFPRPSDRAPMAVHLNSLATRLPLDRDAVAVITVIMSAFGLVLLVAAANVTNLMLARALARQPEIVVRLALGASRWRVARQLLFESLVLAVPAAAVGFALVTLTAGVLPSVLLATWPTGMPPLENVLLPLDIDVRVMACLAVAAVVCAVLVTLTPAVRLAGMRLAGASRGQASSDARGSRLRSGLVAMQIAACVLFLVGAMGLLDASSHLTNPPLNLSYERVSILDIDPMVRSKVAARLQSEPVVERVAAAWAPPMGSPLRMVGVTASVSDLSRRVGYVGVSPDYFPMFDIRIVRGRAFSPAEAAAGAAVALVSEATAAAMWPGLDPLGQTLDIAAIPGRPSDPRVPRGRVRVIGVAEDVGNGSITDGIDVSCVYFATDAQALADMTLLVRTRNDDVNSLRLAVATAVNDVARDTPFELRSMQASVAEVTWGFRALSAIASVLGVVGLLFAYSGTNALVSFVVAQRTREFGVRMVLGASAWRIVRDMLFQMGRTAMIGLAAGLAAAAGLVRLLIASADILEIGVRPFVVGAAVVFIATLVASLVPLRQAARIDPAHALRFE